MPARPVPRLPGRLLTVGKTAPRKIDKARNIAVGGAIPSTASNHGTCLFCALCVDVCPTSVPNGFHPRQLLLPARRLTSDYVQLAKREENHRADLANEKENPGLGGSLRDQWGNMTRRRGS
jgi:ferredoxin